MCMVQDLKQSSLAILLLLTIAEYESLKPQNSSKQSYQAWNQTWTRPQLSTLQSSIWFSYGMHLDSRIQQSFPNFTRFVATLSIRLFKWFYGGSAPLQVHPLKQSVFACFTPGGGGRGGELANFQWEGVNLQGDETSSYCLTGGIDYYIYFGEWLI